MRRRRGAVSLRMDVCAGTFDEQYGAIAGHGDVIADTTYEDSQERRRRFELLPE